MNNHWEDKLKGLLKAELAKKHITHQDLVDKLKELGIETTRASITSKLSRGSFSAVFLLQCLEAINCKEFRIE